LHLQGHRLAQSNHGLGLAAPPVVAGDGAEVPSTGRVDGRIGRIVQIKQGQGPENTSSVHSTGQYWDRGSQPFAGINELELIPKAFHRNCCFSFSKNPPSESISKGLLCLTLTFRETSHRQLTITNAACNYLHFMRSQLFKDPFIQGRIFKFKFRVIHVLLQVIKKWTAGTPKHALAAPRKHPLQAAPN
jgi:hypothetical protein